jgi:Septum formation
MGRGLRHGAGASRPARPLAATVVAVAVGVLAVAGCSGNGSGTDASGTTTTEAATTTTTTEAPLSAGKQFSFYVPAVGDCYDVRPVDKGAPIYLRLDCSLPHQNEVFATFDYTDSKNYPGSQVLETQAKQRCPASWEAYVAKPYETSVLDLAYDLPDQATWGNGIRHVVGCLVVDPSSERRAGSVKGSGL